MESNQHHFNDKGLTLIELLASITLLSIVIILFLSIFSQSMIWSSKVEDRLTAVNLAEKVLNDERMGREVAQPIILNGKEYYFEVTPVNDYKELERNLGLERVVVEICHDLPCTELESKVDSKVYGYLDLEDE